MPKGRVKLYTDEERALRRREAQARYRSRNVHKRVASDALYKKEFRQKFPFKHRAQNTTRHAKRLNRCPAWLTSVHLKEIEQFYMDADYIQNLTKTKMEVDHIIPLQGRIVSGLHVPWNLQILTSTENRTKKNKFKEVIL